MSDLIFHHLKLQNFLSFGNTETIVRFNEGRVTVILGENLDDGGEDARNGVGKSSIMDAIFYALFGKPLREVSKASRIVHRYARKNQSTTVEVVFQKGDMLYLVERGENPSRLFFLGKPIKAPEDIRTRDGKAFKFDLTRSKPNTKKAIIDTVGLDSLMSEYLWGNSSESIPFMKLKEEDKRNVIERLFGFTILTQRAELLKEERKIHNKTLIEKQAELTANEAANRRIYDQIDGLEKTSDAWEVAKTTAIRDLDRREKSLVDNKPDPDSIQKEFTKEADAFNSLFEDNEFFKMIGSDLEDQTSWETARDLASNIDNRVAEYRFQRGKQEQSLQRTRRADQQNKDQYEKLKQDNVRTKLRIDKNLSDLEKNKERDETRIGVLVDKLESYSETTEVGKCPTCGQDWAEHSEEKRRNEIEKIELELAALVESVEGSDARREEFLIDQLITDPERPIPSDTKLVEETISDLTTKIEQEETAGTQSQAVIDAIKSLEGILKSVQDAGKKKIEWDKQIQAIEIERVQRVASQNPYPDQIDSLKKNALVDLKESKNEVTELEILTENYTFLIELLTKKESFLRKRIVDNWLLKVNHKLFKYSQELKLPYTARFDSEMNLTIIPPDMKDDKDAEFGNLSRGERSRLNIAINFAFQDCFEAMNFRTNILFIDELLDNGLDARGATLVLDIIRPRARRSKKHIFLVTHRLDISDQIQDTIMVRKENNVSELVWS